MHVAPLDLPVSRLAALRRRTVGSLVAGVALGSTGHIAAVTVATIVANDLSGSALLSGAPGAAVVLGAALGATLLSRLMVVRGRRIGLATGYGIGVLGAVIATIAVITRSFPLLLFGTVMIGFGNSSNQLSRYTAADLYPTARRASAIGIVVWGATFGAVVGPNLVGPAGDLGVAIGLPPLAGAYLLPMLFVGSAAVLSLVMLRPDPYQLADRSEGDLSGDEGTATSLGKILAQPNVPIAMVSLVTVQVVMTLIMTMTPLHMTETGHSLSAVGLVISAHTFGMFALSPISGTPDRPVRERQGDPGRSRRDGVRGRPGRRCPDGRRRDPVPRPVPPRVRLEPRLRRGVGPAHARPRPCRADESRGIDRFARSGARPRRPAWDPESSSPPRATPRSGCLARR